ncbi:MAG: hypothetical protein AVDCRST_MAG50-1901 [uncultured Acidimicrobiales bacterium]|uniref:L,D-TPase catalytic domain-containing protein n=1 Tax=uncultured Acidimicrobiales bacterium TaxID=310071 RepID=A0A6J4I901_9ACTN|nr:MAG: hypothetical protein AVDCRST_MAG50-1901 [uncultured Acidimicrobiales bacterium]
MPALRRTLALLVLSLLLPAIGAAPASAAEGSGDGTVRAFGAAPFAGSTDGVDLARPLVGMAGTPSDRGYWLVASDGGVFSFGDARFQGSTGDIALNSPVVGMAATPSGAGYWMFASDGGIFSFGDAGFFGSTGDLRLNQPIVGMAPTPTGRGYWLVASDGGVFSFGDARFHGSTGEIRLNQRVVAMSATATGGGYWLVAADGGIFSFGDAGYLGSTGDVRLNQPIVGMAATPSGNGYWLAAADGGVFTFGDAAYHGSSVGGIPEGRVALGIAATTAAGGYWIVAGPLPALPAGEPPSTAMIQQRLLDLGYWGIVDGAPGPQTTQMIYAFQKANGLARDGDLDASELLLLFFTDSRARARSSAGYTLELDKSRQLLLVVRDGFVEWTFNTSTGNGARYSGGIAITPEGRFVVERQINALRISRLGELWRPKYFTGGYAIHGSPSIPPYPASHGCARLSNPAIDFIWGANLAPVGTPFWSYS